MRDKEFDNLPSNAKIRGWVLWVAVIVAIIGTFVLAGRAMGNPLPDPDNCEKGMTPGYPTICLEAVGDEEFPITDPTIYGDQEEPPKA